MRTFRDCTDSELREMIEILRDAGPRDQDFVPDFYRPEFWAADEADDQPNPVAAAQFAALDVLTASADIAAAGPGTDAWAPPSADLSDFDRETASGTIRLGRA